MQGYIRKQAKNKALGKHMQHGGVNSFNFHPSPRMVLYLTLNCNNYVVSSLCCSFESFPLVFFQRGAKTNTDVKT